MRVQRVIAPIDILINQDPGLHHRFSHVVEDKYVDRTRYRHIFRLGRTPRPAVKQRRLQAERSVHVLVQRIESLGLHRIDEFAQCRREQLIRRCQVRVFDQRDHTRCTQCIKLRAFMHRGFCNRGEDADINGQTYGGIR